MPRKLFKLIAEGREAEHSLEAAIAPFGLTPTGFMVLFEIREEALPVYTIADRMVYRKPAINHHLRLLENEGLILMYRQKHPLDERIKLVSLSPKGQKLFQEALAVAQQVEKEVTS
jgi:DNA-binding MarR family transcriptional regulator